jgi:hypothetical protein
MGLGLSVGSYPMVDESSGPLIKFVELLALRAYSPAYRGRPICGENGRVGRHECGAEAQWQGRRGSRRLSMVEEGGERARFRISG